MSCNKVEWWQINTVFFFWGGGVLVIFKYIHLQSIVSFLFLNILRKITDDKIVSDSILIIAKLYGRLLPSALNYVVITATCL